MVRRFWMGVQGKHRGYFECAKNANEFRTTTKLLANKRRKNWLSFCTNLYGSGEKKKDTKRLKSGRTLERRYAPLSAFQFLKRKHKRLNQQGPVGQVYLVWTSPRRKKRGKREASQTEIGWILAYRQHSTAHTCKSWWACNLLTICIQVGMAESPKRVSKKKARGFARQKSINCNQVEWSGTKRVAGKMLRFLIKVFDFGHFLHFPLMAIIWQQKK